ncbi:thiamine biosynthesis protein ThiS [Pyrodictium occultum]|uniref:Thiamine biosynthesis protein ThiS n=1 Tax=Pyrodictium occultum TaxID=2309 RepID=A0A0V8RX21_PYROC|nr:MoaD/ThiS family protein [Pyrodictium occultum]KSW12633.1 thiamine biosynthesis protein ThiS [Pyrodictium occultum]
MAVRVRILGQGERLVEHRRGMTVGDVLRELGLLSNEYVVARRGRVVTEDEHVEDGDELILYPVVSGG